MPMTTKHTSAGLSGGSVVFGCQVMTQHGVGDEPGRLFIMFTAALYLLATRLTTNYGYIFIILTMFGH